MTDENGLVVLLMNALHSHVPEDRRPMGLCDLSDEQAERARIAVRVILANSQAVGDLVRDAYEDGWLAAIEEAVRVAEEMGGARDISKISRGKDSESQYQRARQAQTAMARGIAKALRSRLPSVPPPPLNGETPSLRQALEGAVHAIEQGDLYEQMCCSGADCGCMGSTNAQLAVHHMRAALASAAGTRQSENSRSEVEAEGPQSGPNVDSGIAQPPHRRITQ